MYRYTIVSVLVIMKIVLAWYSNEYEYLEKSHMEDVVNDYVNDRNAMATVTEKEPEYVYEDCYENLEYRTVQTDSMDMIFYGPTASFMRLDGESIMFILINSHRNMIPVTRIVLAWDLLTDGKTSAYLRERELLAFGPLIKYVPEEDLFFVNLGDPAVLAFFAFEDINLPTRKYGILASAYKRYYGTDWYLNSTYINELGYIICGFPDTDLANIPPQVLFNTNVELVSSLRKCSRKHGQALYNVAIHPQAFDVPYTWSSHEIARLDYLLTYVKDQDISTIQLEAVRAITPKVIDSMPSQKLSYFTRQQMLQMNPKTRRLFILKVQNPGHSHWHEIHQTAGFDPKLPANLLLMVTLLISYRFF